MEISLFVDWSWLLSILIGWSNVVTRRIRTGTNILDIRGNVIFLSSCLAQIDEKLGRINLSLLPINDEDVGRVIPREKDVSHLAGVDPNEFRKGVVSAVADYGLFVNVEGVDGLLHVSKMRWVMAQGRVGMMGLTCPFSTCFLVGVSDSDSIRSSNVETFLVRSGYRGDRMGVCRVGCGR